MVTPHPSLSPADVVRIQLAALQNNDRPTHDAGIRAAFEFAAPANRAVTGPIERFIRLVKNPVYAPMLNFFSAIYGRVHLNESQATQMVILRCRHGLSITYTFMLERQTEHPYTNCWMTVGVSSDHIFYLN